ncbi:uncharacterized protein [Watersipora subatra]|uniref:uncharacterized protein n=1 Tax=Watersipora subatra TaxID=2589382 RepID=UPI00355BBED9
MMQSFSSLLILLITLLASLDNFTHAKIDGIWQCSGKQSEYTYLDCQTDRNLTDGCYYLIHFAQYRPCNEVCDGVEIGSKDEERCNANCPDFLPMYCKIGPSESTHAGIAKSQVTDGNVRHGAVTTTDRVNFDLSLHYLPLIGGSFLVLAAIIFSVLLGYYFQRKARVLLPNDERLQPKVGQPIMEEKFFQHPMTVTDYPVQSVGDNDLNLKKENMENPEYSALLVK